MSVKLAFRTLRNVLVRKRPFFAHLALTHRCNLRCRFCQIPTERLQELDTATLKRIVDKLDRMGIAHLSISGGGEPLLRDDFVELVDHAAGRGLYVKLTSNGTASRAKYEALLASRVHEIGISLDGVRGDDLPHSHVGPKLLDNIRFLDERLPRGKKLTLNVTVSRANEAQLDDIVDYCARSFPRARLWLNPVVVGNGKLRVPSERKVHPGFFDRLRSPTLLSAGFYRRACEEYYASDKYDWGCLAGELFFDIKPNGDFWICQDFPAKTPLNILDPDFEEKYRRADFSHRRDCSGCTYSCHLLTQKALEPRNWPDMAVLWWQQTTAPGDPCRDTAERYGWGAGLAHFLAGRAWPRWTPRTAPPRLEPTRPAERGARWEV